jgi:hypothetical protein
MVIEFRYKNVGGCQDNACYGYIRIMQDGLIALGGFQGNAGWVYNVYVDITDEIGTPYTGPSIDVSCQVSVHLAKRFQMRRIKCDKLTDDGRQMTVAK